MANSSFKVTKGKDIRELSTSDSDVVAAQFELWVEKASAYAKSYKANECKKFVEKQIKAEAEITKKNIATQLNKKKEFVEETLEKEKQREVAVQDNLDIFYSPENETHKISEIEEKKHNQGVFDTLLERSLKNPKTELSFKSNPSIKKDNAFLNYMSTRKIEKKIDYLLLTAYYFTQYEQTPRFTLKQLNAKLMQNIAVIIDHSVLQEAINRDYIECLPDLTGLVGASEYRLTAYGEKILLEE
jgi:hypothetical protein